MRTGPCAALLERVGGDERILAELCAVFLADAPRRLALIAEAVATGNARALRREAHAFRGAAAVFDDAAAVEAARRLEQLAAAGDVARSAPVWAELQAHGGRLIEEVRTCRS